MTGVTELALGVAIVVVAGATQRIGGLGFALVAGPLLLLMTGPAEAVKVVLVAGVAASVATTAATWRRLQPLVVAPIAAAAAIVAWPAGLLAEGLDPDVGSLLAGTAVLVALVPTLRPPPAGAAGPAPVQPRDARGRRALTAALVGGASGVMNAVAALGGPFVAAHGLRRGWGSSMVPNLSCFLLVASLAVLAVRGLPERTPPAALALLAAGAVAGTTLGGLAARRLSGRGLVTATAGVAALGGVLAVASGLLGLLTP